VGQPGPSALIPKGITTRSAKMGWRQIAQSETIPIREKLDILFRHIYNMNLETLHLLKCDLVEHVLPIYEDQYATSDQRLHPRLVITTIRDWIAKRTWIKDHKILHAIDVVYKNAEIARKEALYDSRCATKINAFDTADAYDNAAQVAAAACCATEDDPNSAIRTADLTAYATLNDNERKWQLAKTIETLETVKEN